MGDVTLNLIDLLWNNNCVDIPDSKIVAKLRKTDYTYDVVLYDGPKPIGYALFYRNAHAYFLQKSILDTIHNYAGLKNMCGWAIEVHEDYWRRNIGSSMLSLGIGITQKDFCETKPMSKFIMIVDAFGDKKEFYTKFGFELSKEDSGRAIYSKLTVPKIHILDE